MKNKIFSLYFVLFFTAMQSANASGAMSFNGQDGKDPNARNLTVKEWMDLIVRGITVDGLAYYTECPQDVLQNNIKAVTAPGQRILLEQLNAINNQTGELWLDGNNKPTKITTIDDAESIVNAYVALELLEDGKDYTFYSLDNVLNGKTGFVTRKKYFKGEMGFVLTTPITKKKFLLGSATCANPSKLEAAKGNRGGLGGSRFEQFDTTINGQGITLINNITIENNSSVENSGNSTVYPASGSTSDAGEITEITGIDRKHPRTVRTETGEDDQLGDVGGGNHHNTTNSGNTTVVTITPPQNDPLSRLINRGIDYIPQRNYGYRQNYGYSNNCYGYNQGSCYGSSQPRPRPRPSPNPRPTGQGQDYGGVNSYGGGTANGHGQDWDGVD